MSSLMRWSPVSDLMSLHNAMDRLFSESFGVSGSTRSVGAVGEGYLPLDIYQTDKEWVIRASVPGADPQAVEVTFDGGAIQIKGEIKPPQGVNSESFWLRENYYGKFNRTVTLPDDHLGDQSKAQFYNGVLTITVPRAEPARPKTVKIPVTGDAGANSQAQPRELAGTTNRK